MTPNLAVIRIQSGQGWFPPIPLPLFLLWMGLPLTEKSKSLFGTIRRIIQRKYYRAYATDPSFYKGDRRFRPTGTPEKQTGW